MCEQGPATANYGYPVCAACLEWLEGIDQALSQVEDEKGLTMERFLLAVRDHQTRAREALIEQGVHPNVIYAKAEKAARKNYTDYGIVADRPWLDERGIEFLRERGHSV